MLKGNGAPLSPLFASPSRSLPPRMLRVRDGLKDGLDRDITYLRVSVSEPSHLSGSPNRPEGSTEASKPPAMRRNEVIRLVKIFTSLGIRRVRLTGEEPLRRRDLEPLIAGISPEVEEGVHLSTRGILLARRARALHEAGLSGVIVSLPAADRVTFERLTRKNGFDRILAGLEAARAVGLTVRLQADIVRGRNEDQILPLARLAQAKGLPIGFANDTLRDGLGWARGACLSAAEILQVLQDSYGSELEEIPGTELEEGQKRFFRMPGGSAPLSLLSPLGAAACHRCNRVHLDSRGQLMACLTGSGKVDLLAALRHQASHEDLVRLIRQALSDKRECPPSREAQKPFVGTGRLQAGG